MEDKAFRKNALTEIAILKGRTMEKNRQIEKVIQENYPLKIVNLFDLMFADLDKKLELKDYEKADFINVFLYEYNTRREEICI